MKDTLLYNARLIDPETAARVGRCWGYGSGTRGDPGPWEGELRNMWRPTAQRGLWFSGGNLAQACTPCIPLCLPASVVHLPAASAVP